MVVREGSNVTLKCSAKGYPEPYLMWRREDGKEMFIGGENGKSVTFLLTIMEDHLILLFLFSQ